jgi:hypothetical protein
MPSYSRSRLRAIRVVPFVLLALVALAPAGCGGSGNGGGTAPTARVITSDFDGGDNGWTGGFADLPAAPNEFYDLLIEPNAALPPTARGADARGFRIRSSNRSDDVFMFLKRQIRGLAPGVRYRVSYTVTFASNAPETGFGVGGPPGTGVFVKAGATSVEPLPVPDATFPDFLVMNIDKGIQANSGTDARVIGNVAIPGDEFIYTLKTLATAPEQEITATADPAGRLWLIVGTDSGFEGLTDLYYTQINATLTPVL